MEWEVEKTALIELLGKTIYRPENVLVEIAANSYDADASEVSITSSGDSQMLQIMDNGHGMSLDDLRVLTTVAKSKKREYIEKGVTTEKFERKYLGSFGIGIISFLSLGNHIRIFTKQKGGKTYYLEIERELNENGETIDIPISEPECDKDFNQHLIRGKGTESGTTIEIDNSKIDFSDYYDLIRYKLSNLPLSKNFKVSLNKSEITKDDYPKHSWENKKFTISLEDIDPEFNCKVDLHAFFDPENKYETLPTYKRGIFLKVHGRVIEHNLYEKFRANLKSPGTVDARLIGYVEADFLFNRIQANREDFFDNKIIDKICEKLQPKVQELINDILLLRDTVSEEEYLKNFNQQKSDATERIKNIHEELDRLGLSFKYTPQNEQEVILIISELCQKGLLDFNIMSISSSTHIDCFVQWSLKQEKRMPDFVGHLEIETSLQNFFKHQHDYRTKPEIICWDVDEKKFKSEVKRYKRDRPDSIDKVELKDPEKSDKEHFNHQHEVHVTIKNKHDEYKTKVLRVYVLSEIIKDF